MRIGRKKENKKAYRCVAFSSTKYIQENDHGTRNSKLKMPYPNGKTKSKKLRHQLNSLREKFFTITGNINEPE